MPTTIDPQSGVATLINVFAVTAENQRELVRLLDEATEQVMRHQPGFVSANVHSSLDGSRVVNYVQWETAAHFEAMLEDPAAREHMTAAAGLAESFEPKLYAVESTHHVDG